MPSIQPGDITCSRKEGNDVVVANIGVSGFHAQIVKEGDYYAAEDPNSLNGMFVDGKKISRAILKNGNVILVGKHTLEFITQAKQPEQKTQQMRGVSMDETMVIAPQEQEKILTST